MNSALGRLARPSCCHDARRPGSHYRESRWALKPVSWDPGDPRRNPVYNAPADLEWLWFSASQAGRAVGSHEDETCLLTTGVSRLHYLDRGRRTHERRLAVPIQPLIAPLFEGLTELELLRAPAGSSPTAPIDRARDVPRCDRGGEEEGSAFCSTGFRKGSRPAGGSRAGRPTVKGCWRRQTPPCPPGPEAVFMSTIAWTTGATITTVAQDCPKRSPRWPGESILLGRRRSKGWGWSTRRLAAGRRRRSLVKVVGRARDRRPGMDSTRHG